MERKHKLLNWQLATWTQLSKAKLAHTLPHALLLSGTEHESLYYFGKLWLQNLVCISKERDPQQGPCHQCTACHWFTAATHPDFLELTPEGNSQWIQVDQARTLVAFVQQTAASSGPKVVLIHPAENLNVNASNALLKTLEEPPANTYILLLTTQPNRLAATVRSRCRQQKLPQPTDMELVVWLKERGYDENQIGLATGLAPGAPYTALHLIESNFAEFEPLASGLERLLMASDSTSAVAEAFTKDQAIHLNWFSKLISLLIRRRLDPNREVPEKLQLLSEYSEKVSVGRLIEYLDGISQQHRLLQIHSGLNRQLAWEALLLEWQAMFRSDVSNQR